MAMLGKLRQLGGRVPDAISRVAPRASINARDGRGAALAHGAGTAPVQRMPKRDPRGRLSLFSPGSSVETILGFATHRLTVESPHVLPQERLHARIREEGKQGKSVALFIGCGDRAFEVLDARNRPQYQNHLLIGVEPKSFVLPTTLPPGASVAFSNGKWQSVLYDLRGQGLIDEINFVAPSGTEAGLERDAIKNPSLLLYMEMLKVVSESDGDYEMLSSFLKPGGKINFYTENEEWAGDYAKALRDVFGEDSVSVQAVPSNSPALPHSNLLKKYGTTYVVIATRSQVDAQREVSGEAVAAAK